MTADRFAAFAGELDSDAEELLRRFAALVNRGDRAEREATRSLRRGLEDGLPAEAADLRAGLDTLRNAHPASLSAQVSQPTLLIHGAMDPLMPLAGARRLAALLADATLEVDTAAAHAPFLARPQDFVARVLRFAAVAA
jgi:pimeloyl-[acyl-carrier protein] methyl ester esterase